MFATVSELADFLGTDIDDGDPQAVLALESATAIVQAYTRQTLSLVADDEATLAGTWAEPLLLPERPVVEVSSVEVDGTALTSTDYTLDRGTLVRTSGWGGPASAVAVTYTHGYSEIPADIRAVTLSLAARIRSNPDGYARETIGDYSYSYGRGEAGLREEEKAVLDRYRLRVYTTGAEAR